MILHNLNKDEGVTIFITSHLLKEISEICNRVAIVKQGNLIEEDNLDSLLNKYQFIEIKSYETSYFRRSLLLFTDSKDMEVHILIAALIRKEIRENVLSKKSLWIYFAVALLFIVSFSFVSVKELSLLAQVEVNMTFMKVVLGISILVSIIIGSTMYAGEREKKR